MKPNVIRRPGPSPSHVLGGFPEASWEGERAALRRRRAGDNSGLPPSPTSGPRVTCRAPRHVYDVTRAPIGPPTVYLTADDHPRRKKDIGRPESMTAYSFGSISISTDGAAETLTVKYRKKSHRSAIPLGHTPRFQHLSGETDDAD